MTALNDFERLEATALWRPEKDAQKQEVIVSFGEATLTLAAINGTPLSHWSLPAVERVNDASAATAIYRPGSHNEEEIEITDEIFIEAIAKVKRAIDKSTPKRGRMRGILKGAAVAAVVGVAVFWAPNALKQSAANALPTAARTTIGNDLLSHLVRVAGKPCLTPQARVAIARLENRILPEGGDIVVLPSGLQTTNHLPGQIILMSKDIVEDFDTPDIAAGYLIAEKERMGAVDPIVRLLKNSGFGATIQLLTSGSLPDDVLKAHAESLLTSPLDQLDQNELAKAFADHRVPVSPYAYALDVTGESVLDLIEAGELTQDDTEPTLTDIDWVALQNICLG